MTVNPCHGQRELRPCARLCLRVLLLVWWPLVFERVWHYTAATALPADGFLARWLLISVGLFTASAVVVAVRTWRGNRAQWEARKATK
nr:hypothetical protein OG296_04320 [Streptomyces sp. NBC_01001]WSW63143.1 hypothetical protein OG513_33765 [Streptomyces sp. NBC_00998]